MLNKDKEYAEYEICKLNVITKEIEVIRKFNNNLSIHHVGCCHNNRYLSFAPSPTNAKKKYPQVFKEDDIEGYKEVHDAGIEKGKIVIYDMQEEQFMEKEVSAPIPGHTEFDPFERNIVYLFCHNFLFNIVNKEFYRVLEGLGAIYKYKIDNGNLELLGEYTDYDFYRLTQYSLYRYKSKDLIAVSTTPFRLSIIDANKMDLDRRIKVRPFPIPDISKTGSNIAVKEPPLTINLSSNKRYILLGWAHGHCIYDYETDDFLDLSFTIGKRGIGHTTDFA